MAGSSLPVSDVVEIHQLLALYSHLVDDAKFTPVDSAPQQRLDQVFAEDAVFDVSAMNGQRYVGIDAIRETFARPKPYHPPAHHATNPYVHGDGDVVRARSKFLVFDSSSAVMLGEYLDVLVEGPSGWRIQERVVIGTFRSPQPSGPDSAAHR